MLVLVEQTGCREIRRKAKENEVVHFPGFIV